MLPFHVNVPETVVLILNAASVELWFIASSKVTVIIVSMGISAPSGDLLVIVGGILSSPPIVVYVVELSQIHKPAASQAETFNG
ncbi:MAG: hypothetical protein C00003105_01123 [ANME-2 cluster archaeon HR1]|nr:MAG: hypothetical protein C00003105_01123 [ANME-2 cluster archaeon HR1]